MRPNALIVVSAVAMLSACSSWPMAGSEPNTAVIWIRDKPTFRHVMWDGEAYGPTAFAPIARNKGIDVIELERGGEVEIQCAIALAAAVNARAVAGPAVEGGSRELSIADAPALDDACAIKVDIPRPELGSGEFYVVGTGDLVGIEGEAPMSPETFAAHLIERRASAIVLRHASIADLLCFGAIAGYARIQLLKIESDGSFDKLNVSSDNSLAGACGL